ncbi:MAG: 50S ribosomal protein L22 [Eubacteriales bacterium]|nr:50S ribosomal protein L22 [Eubacteriales bacterium]
MATRQKTKTAKRQETAEKRPHATARYIRISSSKVKIVIDLIRGKQVDEALTILRFTPKAASPEVEKVLRSAIANAENNLEMNRDELYVADIRADQGPTLKRYRPRSRGMANPILKRTSHISVILDRKAEKEEA